MNDNQKKPAVICIMNPDDRYLMEGKSQDLSYCITPYDVQKWKDDGYRFPSVHENIIFMQNPLDSNEYVYRTEETDEDVIIKRTNAIETIISLLGGKSFKILSKTEITTTEDKTVSVDVDAKFLNSEITSDTDVNNGNETTDKKVIKIYTEWGGVYTEENYYKAEAIARQYGLINDSLIKGLLAQRHPSNPNFIMKKKYEVNIYKDVKDNLNVAEKLQVDIKKAINIDIDVNVNKISSSKFSETFEFEVEFGPVIKPEPIYEPEPAVKKEQKRWIWWVIGGIVVAGIAVGLLLI